MREDDLQIWSKEILDRFHLPGVIYYHIPNGEKRDKGTARKLKRMGVLPGVPDWGFVLLDGSPAFLELKRPGQKVKTGSDQDNFRIACENLGVRWAQADSQEKIVSVLKEWGIIRNVKL